MRFMSEIFFLNIFIPGKLYECPRRKPGWRFTAGFEFLNLFNLFGILNIFRNCNFHISAAYQFLWPANNMISHGRHEIYVLVHFEIFWIFQMLLFPTFFWKFGHSFGNLVFQILDMIFRSYQFSKPETNIIWYREA